MKMNPGTRPARSSRFSRSPDNGPRDGAPTIIATGPAPTADRIAPDEDRGGQDAGPGHPDIAPRFLECFTGQPEQVARARHFVAAALAGCPAAADAELLSSELATNAVQHSASGHGGSFVVAISHAPGRVRVTVTDGGSATFPAVAAAAEELATSGRGLLLVDGLADRWGYASPPDHPDHPDRPDHGGGGCAPAAGGTVWFELACP
jgi:anti-sigma regulatory factor (Ser/Thr protein kinase)